MKNGKKVMGETIRYSIVSYENATYETAKELEFAYDIDWTDSFDIGTVAEECGRDYYHNRDGWENYKWTERGEPLTVTIWASETESFKYDIYFELTPSFLPLRAK